MSAVRSHKALPVTEWPSVDRDVWSRAQDPGDPFTGPGIAASWAPRSIENAELAYGRLLGFLLRNQRLHNVRRLGERLVPDDLCAFGRELTDTPLASYTVLGIFASLNMAFSAMDPTADRSVLNKVVSRLARRARSTRDIAGNLLSPLQLIAIAIKMMDEADRQTRRSWRRASLYRDGVQIMFGALCPLRPDAVSEMRRGEHVVIDGDRVTVRFPIVVGKKRRLEDIPLPDELARRLCRYVNYYLPMFPTQPPEHANAFWISRNGNPLSRDVISKNVKKRIWDYARKRFSAHMFRHAAATFIVDVAPEHAMMIIGVLGHSGFRTARRHYIKGQQHMALKKYQEAVRELVGRRRSGRTRLSMQSHARCGRGPRRSKRSGADK